MDNTKVVIGCWPLSGDFGNVKLSEIENTINKCLDLGFREFDTAPNYGNGFMEFALGKTLWGRKDETLINTKVGNFPFEGKQFNIPMMQKSVEQSLLRLQVSQINTLFFHNPRTEIENWDEALDWLSKLKREGLIKKGAISLAKGFNYSSRLLNNFDLVQDEANLLNMDALLKLDRNYKLTVRSPLASGILGGRIKHDTIFQEGDHRKGWLKGERLASILKRVDAIESLITQFDLNLTLTQVSQLFLLKSDQIDSVIFGVRTPGHVRKINDALNLSTELPWEFKDGLFKLYQNDFNIEGEEHLKY